MTVQDFPLTTQLRVFKDEEEIADWLIRQDASSYYPIDYIAFINHAPFIYTSLTNECLIRFKMQKDGYHNFSTIVDQVPSWWVDMYTMMESEYLRAQQSKAKDG